MGTVPFHIFASILMLVTIVIEHQKLRRIKKRLAARRQRTAELAALAAEQVQRLQAERQNRGDGV